MHVENLGGAHGSYESLLSAPLRFPRWVKNVGKDVSAVAFLTIQVSPLSLSPSLKI